MSTQQELDNVCEEAVYEGLFMTLSKSLRDFLYYKSGDEALSADIVQEIFIKLWANCKDVPHEKARAYLFKLANNHFLNDVQKQKVRLQYKSLMTQEVNNEDPQYKLEHDEYKARLEGAINALPDGQREVFLMNRIEKKTYAQMAEELGVSQTAIEKRMHKALLKMKDLIGNKK